MTGVQKQIAQQQAQIATANANAQQARAQLAEAQADRQDLTVTAPFDGTVLTRAAEPGEVVQAGTAIITLLDLTKVYLRGFVPEGEIGKVAVGQSAHIYLDSNPKQAVNAYVSRIDPEATFTPENTYFRDDRVKQVVGLKLQLKDGFGFAKPGMPADGEILVQGNTWPKEQSRCAWPPQASLRRSREQRENAGAHPLPFKFANSGSATARRKPFAASISRCARARSSA